MSPPANGNGFSQRYAVIIQTITVVALFSAGAWAIAFSPMVASIGMLQSRQAENRVTIAELSTKIDFIYRDIVRIDARYIENVVPRRENDANNAIITSTIRTISDRLNEVRRDTYQSVTVGDELKRLQVDIVELRRQLAEKK